jgi:hypothetical protein
MDALPLSFRGDVPMRPSEASLSTNAHDFRHRHLVGGTKWICIMLSAAAMSACTGLAKAAVTDCPAPPGATEVVLPSGLPPALRDKIGNIALPGQPFNAIDVYVKGQPNRRYIFVWNFGTKWIVAMEIGGMALRSAVFAYDLGKDGKTATLIDERIGTNNVCGAATKLAAP